MFSFNVFRFFASLSKLSGMILTLSLMSLSYQADAFFTGL